MPSLDEIARHQTSLSVDDVRWLHALVADWQIIADLSFSDLVLWVPDAESKGWWAGAQIRPTTGPTTIVDDVAGTFVPADQTAPLEEALSSGELVDLSDGSWSGDAELVQAVPVSRAGSVFAVVVRRGHESGMRIASSLESAYLEAADELMDMIRRGEFPVPGTRSDLADSLRVGDGFIRADATGHVLYASPNAMSAYRRLGLHGDLVGSQLADVTAGLVGPRPTDQGARGLLTSSTTSETEIENSMASLLLRIFPVRSGGARTGALILLRDVTELRLRERQLVSKEATIREIHHRVKNNLQTVAALLRLQGRRLSSPEARAALEDAVQRVGSIALVHETLSQSFDGEVDFDDISDRLLRTVLEVSDDGVARVTAQRIGSFGALAGEVATPLAMVLTELVQNAAQHAFGDTGGHVTLTVNRIRDRLRVRLSDDGSGLPSEFDPAGSLGLSIVSTLIEGELNGSLEFERRTPTGTAVVITLSV